MKAEKVTSMKLLFRENHYYDTLLEKTFWFLSLENVNVELQNYIDLINTHIKCVNIWKQL